MSIKEGYITGRAQKAHAEEMVERERAAMGGYGPFERDWLLSNTRTKGTLRRLLENVNNGFVEVKEGTLRPRIVGGATASFTSVEGNPSAAPTSFTAVGTTTSETNLWVPAIWSPIPANSMMAGKVYRIEYGGIITTSSAAPGSIWTPRVGQSATPATNITMGATTNVTLIASLSSVPFYGVFTCVIRSLGLAASGAAGTGNGFVTLGGITTTAGVVQVMGATVASTIDNTAATGLISSQTWSASNASNTLTCQWVTPVHSLN